MSQNMRQIFRKHLKDWSEKELQQLLNAALASKKKRKGAKKKSKK